MRSYAFGNQKGGVGKTTFSVYTAAAAAELGARVLVGDLDPQCNTTTTLDTQVGEYTVNDLLVPDDEGEVVEAAAAAAICPAGDSWNGVDVLPASLGQADRETDQVLGREYRLQRACSGCLDGYDLVLWDLPPSLGQLTVNGLVAAHEVIVIVEPKRYALEGAGQMMATITRTQRYYNPSLVFGGIQANQVRERTIEGRTRIAELHQLYDSAVREPLVPYMETVTKAAGAGATLDAYGAEGRAAAELFRAVAKQLLDGSGRDGQA